MFHKHLAYTQLFGNPKMVYRESTVNGVQYSHTSTRASSLKQNRTLKIFQRRLENHEYKITQE